MIMLDIVISILCAVGWAFAAAQYNKRKHTEKLLLDSYKNAHSTPIKELASSFRDFVESIDGKVSPEIEEAIKKLETTEEQKALPAHTEQQKETKLVKKHGKFPMTKDIWSLFCDDINKESYDDDKMTVIHRWGKKYNYTLQQQGQLIKTFGYNDDRHDLRNYFDKEHNKD